MTYDPQAIVASLEKPLDALVVLDFETFYGDDYTLSNMTTEQYIRDPRFEVIGVGVRIGEHRSWMTEQDFRKWASTVNWERVAVLAHHAHFDGLILSHHFGIKPGFWFCTLSMARALHGIDVGNSLAKLGPYYGAGEKGHEVVEAKGKRLKDFTAEEWLQYGRYCVNDCDLAFDILQKMLAAGYPEVELWLIDTTVRMFTEPELVLDEPLLEEFLIWEKARKAELIQRVGADKKTLGSNAKFSALLLDAGLEEIPMKRSATHKCVDKCPKAGTSTPKGKPHVCKPTCVCSSPCDRLYIEAFAKSDPGMQELLEHPEDEIRWLAEARIAVKSNINETRTERFLRCGKNGAFTAYLKYSAAHTGRWGGGDKMNPQNLERTDKKNPRKGAIRKALCAPKGKKCVVADSSQVEARVDMWLAGQDSVVATFRKNDETGGDFYSDEGSAYFGRRLSKEETPTERQIAKGMCLAGDTQVLTDRGWTSIVTVRASDKVWDGVEWVAHAGLVCKGVKTVWRSSGVSATADHGILTGSGWREWREVLTDLSLFQSALGLATLPSYGGSGRPPSAGISLSRNATADGLAGSRGPVSSQARASGVTSVQRRPPQKPDTSGSRPPSPTTSRGSDSSTGSAHAYADAKTRGTGILSPTVDAAFGYTHHGLMTGLRSSHTSSNSQAGTTRTSNSTGSTTTEGTNLETSGSLHSPRTWQTAGPLRDYKSVSPYSKRRTRTYDLASAGPRHRFTILTEAGPIIAHNCLGLGFQMGLERFANELLKGMLGAPPVQFTNEDAAKYGIDVGVFHRWLMKQTKRWEKFQKTPSRISLPARVIHCAVAKYFHDQYRERNDKVVELWATMEKVIECMAAELDVEPADGVRGYFGTDDNRRLLKIIRHGIVLPNGMKLRYPGLRESDEGGYSYIGGYGKTRKHIYGGLLTENVVQALARIIVADQMLMARADGQKVAMMTHDEMCNLVPEAEAEATLERNIGFMRLAPPWAPTLPLNAEGGIAVSYGLAK